MPFLVYSAASQSTAAAVLLPGIASRIDGAQIQKFLSNYLGKHRL